MFLITEDFDDKLHTCFLLSHTATGLRTSVNTYRCPVVYGRVCTHNPPRITTPKLKGETEMRRMKWMLAAAVMLVAVTTAQAQCRFGVKGGVNIASVSFDRHVLDAENITGFHVGPMLEWNIPLLGLGIDGAVLYSQRGFGVRGESLRSDYIDVPVNAKFKFGLPLISPFLAAGPYASFRVSSDKSWDISGITDQVIRQVEAQSFAAGLNFTAGAEVMEAVQVGLTYSLGLTDNYKAFDRRNVNSYSGKPHTWMVSATVFF